MQDTPQTSIVPATIMQGKRARHTGPDGEEGSRTAAVAQCAAAFSKGGITVALRFLNERTRFRFTGVYHAEAPFLRNVVLFDRENPTLNISGDLSALDASYCAITRDGNAPFITRDASSDPRLATHAARDSVLSYAGVPIRLESGVPWGTLCHFDVRPRLLPPEEIRVLEAIAPLFARWVAERSGDD